MKWIPIFKAGTHRDMRGRELTYSEVDLDNMVKLYNEQPQDNQRLAPHVIGHPATDAPAYGWVRKLQRVGDVLFAGSDQFNDEFVESINKGAYKMRSASFYHNGLLRHVGWLGGTQPAVAGLGEVSFAADEDVAGFEYGEDAYDWTIEDAFRQTGVALANLRDWLIEKESLEVADRIIPTYYVDSFKRVKLPSLPPPQPSENTQHEPAALYAQAGDEPHTVAGTPDTEPDSTTTQSNNKESAMSTSDKQPTAPAQAAPAAANTQDFSEELNLMKTAQDAALARISALEAENNRLRDDLARREFSEFCQGLVQAGKMLPAETDFYVNDLMMKSKITDFAEGANPVEATKNHLNARAPHALFSEFAGRSSNGAPNPVTIPNHLPNGSSVDPAAAELDAKAVAYSEANNVSYAVALQTIINQGAR